MVGGANLIDKIKCNKRIGTDINSNVINLLKYVQENPDIPIAPEDVSFEHYKDVRKNQNTGKYSPEYVALIGYCASYGGRYFDGGYGRDAKGDRCVYKERLANLKKQAEKLKGIEFDICSYDTYTNFEYDNCLFYCDPPYRNTKQYGKQKFDYNAFYVWCSQMSQNNIVLVSEFYMPDRFDCIWQKERQILQKSDRINGETKTEKLFVA